MEDCNEKDLRFFKLHLEECLREFDNKNMKPSDAFAAIVDLHIETVQRSEKE